jgi:hypothetical protein
MNGLTDYTNATFGGKCKSISWAEIVCMRRRVERSGSILVIESKGENEFEILLQFLSREDGNRLLQEIHSRLRPKTSSE